MTIKKIEHRGTPRQIVALVLQEVADLAGQGYKIGEEKPHINLNMAYGTISLNMENDEIEQETVDTPPSDTSEVGTDGGEPEQEEGKSEVSPDTLKKVLEGLETIEELREFSETHGLKLYATIKNVSKAKKKLLDQLGA